MPSRLSSDNNGHTNGQNGYSTSGSSSPIPPLTLEYDILIVGAGLAGLGLATFLSHMGVHSVFNFEQVTWVTQTLCASATGITNVLMINKAGSTADTPRAHFTNAAAMECLRDVDLEDEAINAGVSEKSIGYVRFTDTFLGEEYARVHAVGTGPYMENYHRLSPSAHLDIPQTLLEPILLRESTTRGVTARFNTQFLSCTHSPTDGVTSLLHDTLINTQYTVKSKYLIAADGAKSAVIENVGIPLDVSPAGALAVNVYFKCDMTEWMRTRGAILSHVYKAGERHPAWAPFGIMRAIKPWKTWIMILIMSPHGEKQRPTPAEFMARTRELIGPSCPPTTLISTSVWRIRETVARTYTAPDNLVFGAGDAVHRHPPANGLGSNTSIQDAYNLAWKLAFVLQGKAGKRLLGSYSAERQPVGQGIIKRANDGMRDHGILRDSLGFFPRLDPENVDGNEDEAIDAAVRSAQNGLKELHEDSEAGRERRRAFVEALGLSDVELNAFGIEMNQFYESDAIYLDDVEGPAKRPENLIMDHVPSTYPGSRLPHAWLSTKIPFQAPISTHDLAGKGAFSLFTGIGGTIWLTAASSVSAKLGTPINTISIGYGLNYTDLYKDWFKRSGVEDNGCVLVRPDRFVAWRAKNLGVLKHGGGAEEKLERVLRRVLDLPLVSKA